MRRVWKDHCSFFFSFVTVGYSQEIVSKLLEGPHIYFIDCNYYVEFTRELFRDFNTPVDQYLR